MIPASEFSPTRSPDFEAQIRLLSAAEGGRRTLPPLRGWRAMFRYADEPHGHHAWEIWPAVLVPNEAPETWVAGAPITEARSVHAHMFILNAELRRSVHLERISPGTRFFVQEGQRVVGEGIVTKPVAIAALAQESAT
jgi:Elongation factor Tu C-terminal domain